MLRPAWQWLGQKACDGGLCLYPLAYRLYAYHHLIMEEMADRGYKVSPEWLDKNYRGKICPPYQDLAEEKLKSPIYSEHDHAYYEECLANLCDKGIEL